MKSHLARDNACDAAAGKNRCGMKDCLNEIEEVLCEPQGIRMELTHLAVVTLSQMPAVEPLMRVGWRARITSKLSLKQCFGSLMLSESRAACGASSVEAPAVATFSVGGPSSCLFSSSASAAAAGTCTAVTCEEQSQKGECFDTSEDLLSAGIVEKCWAD